MSIKRAATRAFTDNAPTESAIQAFCTKLGRELEQLGFKEAKSPAHRAASHQFCYAPASMGGDQVKSLIIVGPVTSFPDYDLRLAAALKIDFHGTGYISVTPDTPNAELGKFRDIEFDIRRRLPGEPNAFKWSERNALESLLARWITENAAPKIVQQLRAPAP